MQVAEHDVLVIGAGGAGLRAAIEASGAGVSVGLVTKSLLGKAHTVMAEGGIAAALANVDGRDDWRTHFADTMRGGQYVNNPTMAELHAKEAPDRVRELEAWGAVFDRTNDQKILQRNFGGHKYPRLAHVGDRTGLEMIRTLQDHGIHLGIDVHMEWTVTRLIMDGGRVVGAFGYDREKGRFQLFRASAVVLATGGIGRAYRITSNSWEYTGDGHALAYEAGAELIDMEYVQFHPTGMVWPPSVRGILVTEGVRGEGGVLRNSEGRRFMFDDIPDLYKGSTASDPEEGWRYTQGDKEARRPPELLTRDHVARCIVREIREGRGSPHGGVFLDIAWIREKLKDSEAHIRRKLPSMYHQFKELAGIDITGEAMEVGPTTHYVMGGVRVDGETQMSRVPGLFAALASAPGASTGRTVSAGTPSPICWSSASAPASTRRCSRARIRTAGRRARRTSRSRRPPATRSPHSSGRMPAVTAWVPTRSRASCRTSCRRRSASCAARRSWSPASRACSPSRSAPGPSAWAATAPTTPAGTPRSTCRTCCSSPRPSRGPPALRKESRGAHFREDHTAKDEHWGNTTLVVRKGADGGMEIEEERVTPPRDELQQIIEENR